jgi:PAS domain S-box-containing protein
MKEKSIKTGSQRILFLPFAAIIFMIILGGYLFYKSEDNSVRAEKSEELKAIAKLKIKEITDWRSERLAEAKFFSTNQAFIHNTIGLSSNKNKNNLEEYFTKTLLPIKLGHGYENIYLISKNHQILFSLNRNKLTKDIDSTTIKDIDSSITYKKIIFSDFHLSAQNKIIHLNIIAPVINKDKIPVGALVFRICPENYLYPLIQHWPIPSKTAETLIVRKDGNDVVFLNELRFRKNAALKLRIPLTNTEVAAVKAVLNYNGIFEGKDYRGVKTLAYLSSIPGTNWFMISKVDQKEIYSGLYFRLILISLLVLALIFSLSMGMTWFYYYKQRNFFKALWQTEEEFRTTLYSIGDAVITTDKAGIIKQMNLVAEQLTGWREDEAKGKPLVDVFKIINENTRAKVDNPVEKVLSEGNIVGLANHTLLISKDGNEIPIEDSGAPIKNEDNQTIGVVLVFRDQTEEREALKKLLKSEAKFRHTFENASIGKFLTSITGNIIEVNEAFCKMLGYSKDELTEINFSNISHPDDVEISNRSIQCLLNGEKETSRLEKRYLKKNGEIIWTDVNVMLLKDSEGKPEFFITHVIDITERKKAEERIIKFNRIYAVISQINQAIVRIKDRDELLREVCRIAIELGKFQMAWFGFVDEQTGYITPLTHAGNEDGYLSNAGRISIYNVPEGNGPTGIALREGRYVVCNDIEKDSSMAIWKDEALKRDYRSSIALPIKLFGKVNGAFSLYSSTINFFDKEEISLLDEISNDISFFLETIEIENRRKEIEESLRESEEKFRMVFENVYDGIGIFIEDEDLSKRRLIDCNKRYAEMAGRTREELLKIGIIKDLQISLEDDSNQKRIEAIEKGSSFRGSFSWIRPDGKENVIEYVGVPIMWGGKHYAVGIDRDITERKKILEELIRAKEKAENSDKLKSEFLSQVSHEIRTPLVSIVNYTDLICQDIKESNIVYLPEYLEAVSNAGKRIKRTFDLIVNAAQVITHNYEPNFTTFNLVKDVLNEIYDEYIKSAERKNLEFILIDDSKQSIITADQYSVTQLFSNLVDNAIKYTDKGFVKIEVTSEDKIIFVRIIDSGIGISKDFLPYIFEPFRQEEQGYSRKFEGNGLGLTLVKYYCEINNADIQVESRKGVGTTFTVKFIGK